MSTNPLPTARRADAERNRDRILAVARVAFDQSGNDVSMAELARRADVGMATLYRNFPGRRELLEALYQEEVDAVCAAAETGGGETPGAVLLAWLRQFLAFSSSKADIAAALLTHVERTNPVFNENRSRVLAAGRPLLVAAQRAHEVRRDLTLEQVLDMIMAVTRIPGDASYLEPILQTTLDGLATPAPVRRGRPRTTAR